MSGVSPKLKDLLIAKKQSATSGQPTADSIGSSFDYFNTITDYVNS